MITHEQAVKQAATDAVVDRVDLGGGANGTFEILAADNTVLSSHAMANPAFGAAASTGLATAGAIADDPSANATGTAAKWRIKDTAGTVVMTGQAGLKRSIVAVATGAGGTVSIAGDHTAEFAAGTDFNITGSTGNDGGYTVASVTYTGGNTVITVEKDQTISNATADGKVHVGEFGLDNTSIAATQQVVVSSFAYKALRS